jgi:hypothetical protein
MSFSKLQVVCLPLFASNEIHGYDYETKADQVLMFGLRK